MLEFVWYSPLEDRTSLLNSLLLALQPTASRATTAELMTSSSSWSYMVSNRIPTMRLHITGEYCLFVTLLLLWKTKIVWDDVGNFDSIYIDIEKYSLVFSLASFQYINLSSSAYVYVTYEMTVLRFLCGKYIMSSWINWHKHYVLLSWIHNLYQK